MFRKEINNNRWEEKKLRVKNEQILIYSILTGRFEQALQVRSDDKSNTPTKGFATKNNFVVVPQNKKKSKGVGSGSYRKLRNLTPEETEELQTFPRGYTACSKNKMKRRAM